MGKTSRINTKIPSYKEGTDYFQSKFINSKLNQSHWKDNLRINSLNTIVCTNETELEYCLSCMSFPCVIKQEFSFAGRGNIILKQKVILLLTKKKNRYYF